MTAYATLRSTFDATRPATHHPGTFGDGPRGRDAGPVDHGAVLRSRPPLRRRTAHDEVQDCWPDTAHDDIMWRTGVRWDAEGGG